mmetsp:Transcript_64696/g.140955  ORF Transcript_64696/g.140955 Transcript_64696/m.140955 type:complete len:346 (-) Transcript_64696:32-1069(-)
MSDGRRVQPEQVRSAAKTVSLANWWNKERIAFAVSAASWITTGIVAYSFCHAVEWSDGRKATVLEACYLMVQIITGIGYGDLTAHTRAGKFFVSLHIIWAFGMVSGLVAEFLMAAVAKQASRATDIILKVFDDHDPTRESVWERNARLLGALGALAAVVFCWTLYFSLACDLPFLERLGYEDSECEKHTLTQSFYFAVVSLTTVGFGDITPRTHLGVLFFTVVAPLGVVTGANFVDAISDRFFADEANVWLESISSRDLVAADVGSDGKVDLYEFTRFVLTRYGIVSEEVFNDIRRNFEGLDTDGSGHLSIEDMMGLVKAGEQRKLHQRASTSGAQLEGFAPLPT